MYANVHAACFSLSIVRTTTEWLASYPPRRGYEWRVRVRVRGFGMCLPSLLSWSSLLLGLKYLLAYDFPLHSVDVRVRVCVRKVETYLSDLVCMIQLVNTTLDAFRPMAPLGLQLAADFESSLSSGKISTYCCPPDAANGRTSSGLRLLDLIQMAIWYSKPRKLSMLNAPLRPRIWEYRSTPHPLTRSLNC